MEQRAGRAAWVVERATVLVITVVALVALTPGVAAGHGDVAVLRLERVTPTEGGTGVTVEVSLLFRSDGHPVLEASMRLAGTSDRGVTLMPLQMRESGEPGHYAVTAELGPDSGAWELRVVADEPEADIAFDYDPESPESTETEVSGSTAEIDRGGGVPFVQIAAGCALVALVAVVFRLRRRGTAGGSGRGGSSR